MDEGTGKLVGFGWLVPGDVPRSSQVLFFTGGTWGLADVDMLYCAE